MSTRLRRLVEVPRCLQLHTIRRRVSNFPESCSLTWLANKISCTSVSFLSLGWRDMVRPHATAPCNHVMTRISSPFFATGMYSEQKSLFVPAVVFLAEQKHD